MVAKVGGFGSVVVCCQGIDFVGGCRGFLLLSVAMQLAKCYNGCSDVM